MISPVEIKILMNYNIITMTQPVKKYHYSVHLPNKNYKGIVVTNAAHLNGSTYVATSSTNNPILKFDIYKDGKLVENPVSIDSFSKTKVKFIGFIKDKLAVIPRHNWNIYVLNDDGKGHKPITINSDQDLKKKFVEAITYKNTNVCKCEDCYHLIGFVQYYGFNIFVQLSCKHKTDQNLLYIIKANINTASMECDDDLEVTNEYNYYRLCLDNGMSERQAKSAIFTGLNYDGSKVYLISAHGRQGFLWEMSYFNNISYLGPPTLVAKLRRKPRGIYSFDDKLVVVCTNIEHQRAHYYMISH